MSFLKVSNKAVRSVTSCILACRWESFPQTAFQVGLCTSTALLQAWPCICSSVHPASATCQLEVVFIKWGCVSAALVCDVEAKKAVERLYQAKGMEPSKQLSILCKNFSDIQMYTLGFPLTSSGQDTFRIARRALPGPVRLLPLSSSGESCSPVAQTAAVLTVEQAHWLHEKCSGNDSPS